MINFNTNANSTQKTWSHHSLQQPKSRPVTIYIPDVIPKSLQLDDSETLNHLKEIVNIITSLPSKSVLPSLFRLTSIWLWTPTNSLM